MLLPHGHPVQLVISRVDGAACRRCGMQKSRRPCGSGISTVRHSIDTSGFEREQLCSFVVGAQYIGADRWAIGKCVKTMFYPPLWLLCFRRYRRYCQCLSCGCGSLDWHFLPNFLSGKHGKERSCWGTVQTDRPSPQTKNLRIIEPPSGVLRQHLLLLHLCFYHWAGRFSRLAFSTKSL